jgi:hypothetical protein
MGETRPSARLEFERKPPTTPQPYPLPAEIMLNLKAADRTPCGPVVVCFAQLFVEVASVTKADPFKQRSPIRFSVCSGIGFLLIVLSACSPVARQRAAKVAVAAAAGMAGTPTSGSTTTKLMIFGGPDHKVYLGCLDCGEYATDEVAHLPLTAQ